MHEESIDFNLTTMKIKIETKTSNKKEI